MATTHSEPPRAVTRPTPAPPSTDERLRDPAYQAFFLLRTVFTVAPILFGLDKYFHVLVNWDRYVAPDVLDHLPWTAHQVMYGVGAIEIAAGLVVAFRPRFGGYLVAAWLAAIIVNLLLIPGFYDVALRDFGLLVGALALARLATAFRPATAGAGRGADRDRRRQPSPGQRRSGDRPDGGGAGRARPARRARARPRRGASRRRRRGAWPARTPRCSRRSRSTSRRSPTTRATTSWSLARDIPFQSLCEHHLLPFHGVAHVGYVPGRAHPRPLQAGPGRRAVRPRPAGPGAPDDPDRRLAPGAPAPKGVGVVLEAEHLCMSLRGVRATGTRTVTSAAARAPPRRRRARARSSSR